MNWRIRAKGSTYESDDEELAIGPDIDSETLALGREIECRGKRTIGGIYRQRVGMLEGHVKEPQLEIVKDFPLDCG